MIQLDITTQLILVEQYYLREQHELDGFVGQTSDTVGGFFVQDDGGKVLIDRVREDRLKW